MLRRSPSQELKTHTYVGEENPPYYYFTLFEMAVVVKWVWPTERKWVLKECVPNMSFLSNGKSVISNILYIL